jgi:hypothetical protein
MGPSVARDATQCGQPHANASGHYQVGPNPPSGALYSTAMRFANMARVLVVVLSCFAALGSATSNNNSPSAVQPQMANMSPPPPQEMDSTRALGLWRSTFGAVKIEADNNRGGIQAGAIQGVWVYTRKGDGQEVVGYFWGTLRGNVLDFRWQEPNNPPLVGAGYLVFDQSGRQYSGRWWTDKRDRVGDWNGSRQATTSQPNYTANPYGGSPYGGQPYGTGAQPQYPPQPGYPQQPQYPQQPAQPYPPQQPQYPQQQPQYPQQQQPYPQQPPQQPYYPQQPQPTYPRSGST